MWNDARGIRRGIRGLLWMLCSWIGRIHWYTVLVRSILNSPTASSGGEVDDELSVTIGIDDLSFHFRAMLRHPRPNHDESSDVLEI